MLLFESRKREYLVDGQTDAFFADAALDDLEEFLVSARGRVALQPNYWQQRVGRTWPEGEPVYKSASRAEAIALLDRLIEAVLLARESGMGLLFLGE